MSNAIVVENLSKRFSRYSLDKPHTFQELVLKGLCRQQKSKDYWALNEVSFSVGRGQMVGLIGRNGSGKSTLLRLIGGLGKATRGNVQITGNVRALLDVGVGLHPDLTGRENTFVSGIVSGLTRREVERRFESIVSFAELESFIDNPLRTYSTGMRMRLGFSIAVHTSPDILLVDEVLAVGDLAFQRKCLERIMLFKEQGCTILFVSHDETQVKRLCDEVIYLHKGYLISHGHPEPVIDRYLEDIKQEIIKLAPARNESGVTFDSSPLVHNQNRFGSLDIEILSVSFLDRFGFQATEIKSGDAITIVIYYNSHKPIYSPVFGIIITNEDELVCCDTTTAATGELVTEVYGKGQVTLYLERLDLNGGCYFINPGIYDPNNNHVYDYHWKAYPLTIETNSSFEKGLIRPPHHWFFAN